jgi:hypothetical protein
MASSKGNGAPGVNVISRRDAIVGALALAAGALVASKPDAAQAANYEQLAVGSNLFGTLPTAINRTSNAAISGVFHSSATLNYVMPITNADIALNGTVWEGAVAGSAGVLGRGTMTGQYGVVATHDTAAGTALKVEGRATFSRSGRVTITKTHGGCTVTVASGISATTLILATLQGSAGTGVYLVYAKYASPTTFTIKLNKAATSTVQIAWFIIG